MLLVALAWLYVVLMVAVVEATSTGGTLLGAVFTLLLYGVLPLAIVGYLFLSPARRRARRAVETSVPVDVPADELAAPFGSALWNVPGDASGNDAASGSARPAASIGPAAIDPDRSGHAAGHTIPPERKKA